MDISIFRSNSKDGSISITCHDELLDWYKLYLVIMKDGVENTIDMLKCDGVDLINDQMW